MKTSSGAASSEEESVFHLPLSILLAIFTLGLVVIIIRKL